MTNEDIKRWCKSKKITQAELAQKISYSAGQLAQVLNGFKTMTPRMLEAIKRVMDEHERPQVSPMSQEAITKLRGELKAAKQGIESLEQALEAIAPQGNLNAKE